MWRSQAAHLLWEQGVGGSNPPIPTSSACLTCGYAGLVASGGFSSPSVHLAQVLFRNEVECRASGSPAARIYTEDVRDTHHPPPQGRGASESKGEFWIVT